MKDAIISNDINFYLQDLKVFIPVVGGLIGFIIFWFINKSENIKNKFIDKYGVDKGSAKFIIFCKYLGGISMGLLPMTTFLIVFPDTSFSQFGLGLNRQTILTTLFWIILLCAIIIPLVNFNSRKPKNFEHYPEIRVREWSKKLVVSYLAAWAGYLLGYELLFRGVLFFPLVEKIGLWPAIAVNIGMYSGTHIPKGIGETIGAIPLSIVLCLLCAQTGNIWVAFFVHVAIAWTSNLTSLKYNPEMKIITK